ncbi:MAG: hypothetical protein H5T86_03770 [Armatimonadetes bacterium]|nr:hypothetical protein [Armatimonadota bacterium]
MAAAEVGKGVLNGNQSLQCRAGCRWRGEVIIAVAICLSAWVCLVLTAADVGLTYDEPVYMSRADLASQWLSLLLRDPAAALTPRAIAFYWPAKDQQPGLVKLTAAVTGPLCLALGLLPAWAVPLVWLRTGTIFWVGLGLGIMYLLMRAAGTGRAASLFAPAATLFLPRVFGHSHLLALDAPAMSTCFIALAATWWAAGRTDRLSIVLAGMAAGLAAATKVNGFFVPLAALPYALAVNPRRAAWLAAAYVFLMPAVLIGTWPWLWFDTLKHLSAYLAFHWHHWEIGVMYFGRIYTLPPWHYPLVMTAITTPLIPLILCIGGLGRWGQLCGRLLRQRSARTFSAEEKLWLLAGLALIANIGPSMLPSSPKYGGVRLFLPAFAWMSILAALALNRLIVRIHSSLRGNSGYRRIASALILTAGVLPSVSDVAHFHPYELSYYNALIGGLPGAAARGFEPTYWGETYLAAAAWLSSNAPPGSSVWIDPPGVESIMRMYKYLGALRPDIVTLAGAQAFHQADFAVSQNKPTEFSDEIKHLLRTRPPVWTQQVDGVPLIFVWRLRPKM